MIVSFGDPATFCVPQLGQQGRVRMPPLPEHIRAELLTTPGEAEPFLTRFKRVVAARPPGDGFVEQALGCTAWGTIRWSRTLGYPLAPRMADAFSVRFQYLVIKDGGVDPSGVVINKSEWEAAPPPLTWDGPHDEEHFRVSFLHIGFMPWLRQIIVEMIPGIQWQDTAPWWLPPARRLRHPASLPGNGTFHLNRTAPVFLEDFVVVNAFY
jgi:hypothetical protein